MGGLTTKVHRATALAKRKQLVADEAKKRGGCEWPCCGEDGHSWHHIDPSNKSFGISRSINNKGRVSIAKELAKCKWLCHGHHHMAEAYLLLGMPSTWDLA